MNYAAASSASEVSRPPTPTPLDTALTVLAAYTSANAAADVAALAPPPLEDIPASEVVAPLIDPQEAERLVLGAVAAFLRSVALCKGRALATWVRNVRRFKNLKKVQTFFEQATTAAVNSYGDENCIRAIISAVVNRSTCTQR